MNKQRKGGLGRGLETLLGKPALAQTAAAPGTAADTAQGGLRQVAIDRIDRGAFQPRRHFDAEELDRLADSIRAQGVVQPVILRPKGNRFELIAGERRWRAAQRAGLSEIPAMVRDIADSNAMAIALIENVQRRDLNPLEEAAALKRLLDEFGMTHQQVADSVGRSRAAVTNLIRLLGLSPEVRDLLDSGQLEMGHARALLPLAAGPQGQLAREVVRRGLNVRQTEALIDNQKRGAAGKPPRKPVRDPNIARLENDLGERLGAAVSIRHQPKGTGKLEIRYGSLAELEGILERIR